MRCNHLLTLASLKMYLKIKWATILEKLQHNTYIFITLGYFKNSFKFCNHMFFKQKVRNWI